MDDLVNKGVDFLCVLGTTAETPCLSDAEKTAVMQTVVETTNGRVPLLLGCGSNNTSVVVDYLKNTDLTAFDGVLIVTPYYNKPSQEGLYRHYKAVADASPLPVVLYNVPGRTGVNLQATTTIRIARDCENVVAIKEASGNIHQIEDILAEVPDGFEVLSGDDAITLDLISMGAVGVISVVGNACPAEFGEVVHKALEDDYTTAVHGNRTFHRLFRLVMVDGNPSGVKSLLALQGKIQNVLRLPLVPASVETQTRIKEWMQRM